MLTPSKAIELVLEAAQKGRAVERPLEEACFLVTAEDVIAEQAYPYFSYSSMDGYAVHSEDLDGASADNPVTLPLAGEIRAATGKRPVLPRGQAIRIMTGGPMPEGSDAVVQQEDVDEKADLVTFYGPVAKGNFINREGEEIARGDILWPAGKALNPAAIGLIATFGVSSIAVYPAPSVFILTTGDELIAPGEPRGYGEIYDSVTPMLASALRRAGFDRISSRRCKDDRGLLLDALSLALAESDIVVSVGGVSVGEYDFVRDVAERAGVEKIFWKVSQKPGKPLYFGKKGDTLLFGLPGNPAAALACLQLYVLPAARRIMGYSSPGPEWLNGVIAEAMENRTDRTNFLRVVARKDAHGGYLLERAGGQSSYMLSSFSRANALAQLPPGPVRIDAGEKVQFAPLFWDVE